METQTITIITAAPVIELRKVNSDRFDVYVNQELFGSASIVEFGGFQLFRGFFGIGAGATSLGIFSGPAEIGRFLTRTLAA